MIVHRSWLPFGYESLWLQRLQWHACVAKPARTCMRAWRRCYANGDHRATHGVLIHCLAAPRRMGSRACIRACEICSARARVQWAARRAIQKQLLDICDMYVHMCIQHTLDQQRNSNAPRVEHC